MSAEQTLNIIQGLYEKKLTTYPRVDTQYLSDDIYPKCPQTLAGLMGRFPQIVQPLNGKVLKKSKRVFDSSKVTDHHAIIPTGVPARNLTDMEAHVYDLVAKRFIAVFYPDCKFATTTVMGRVEKIDFKVSGKTILDEGWRAVYKKDAAEQTTAANPSFSADNASSDKALADIAEERTLPPFVKGESGDTCRRSPRNGPRRLSSTPRLRCCVPWRRRASLSRTKNCAPP